LRWVCDHQVTEVAEEFQADRKARIPGLNVVSATHSFRRLWS
jgi:hypothetical protein